MSAPDFMIAFTGPVERTLMVELAPDADEQALRAFVRAARRHDSRTLTTYPLRRRPGHITMPVTYDRGCPTEERERFERWVRTHPLVTPSEVPPAR